MFSWLELRTHCHATEDRDKVAKILEFLCPGAGPSVKKTEGYHKNPILVLTIRTNKKKDIRTFWRLIKGQGLIAQVLDLLEGGIDGSGVLHFRLGKQEAFQGKIVLASHDDTVVAKLKIVRYPSNKGRHADIANDTIRELTQDNVHDT